MASKMYYLSVYHCSIECVFMGICCICSEMFPFLAWQGLCDINFIREGFSHIFMNLLSSYFLNYPCFLYLLFLLCLLHFFANVPTSPNLHLGCILPFSMSLILLDALFDSVLWLINEWLVSQNCTDCQDCLLSLFFAKIFFNFSSTIINLIISITFCLCLETV